MTKIIFIKRCTSYYIYKQLEKKVNLKLSYAFQIHTLTVQPSISSMEVEYSGGGVLIFSYVILIHQLEHIGGLYDNQVEPRQLDRVGSLATALMAQQ